MSKPEPEAKTEVVKHSAAIQIENNITLLQRKAWNVLLANAYDDLPTQDIHQIGVQYLMRSLQFNSKNDHYLKEAIEALIGCKVKWNLLDKDGSEIWGAAALLASAEIQQGVCTYGFAPHLRQRLHNPRIYARLNLSLQNRFESKHALALWELFTDYLGSRRDYGETPFIPLEEFRKLMGIGKDEYPRFNNLTLRVLKPALDEINSVSDFRVTVAYQRQGRKITALKFKIRRMEMLPEASTVQAKLFPELDDMPIVVRELMDAGLSSNDAWDIWQQGVGFLDETARQVVGGEDEETFTQYIREKIHLLKRRQASGKIENSTGFLLQAIRQNYTNPEYELEQKRQEVSVRQQARHEREKQAKMLERQKADIEKARDKALDQLSSEMAAEVPGVLDQAAKQLCEESSGFRYFYDGDKPALQNYQARKAIQAFLNPYLERHEPARFEPVRQDYAAQIAAVDEEIAALSV